MASETEAPDSGKRRETVSSAWADWAERERKAGEARRRERAELRA